MPIKKKNIRDFEVEENNFSADQSNNKTQNKSGLSGSLLILPMLVAIIIAGWFGYDWYRSEREVERLSQKPTAPRKCQQIPPSCWAKLKNTCFCRKKIQPLLLLLMQRI